MDKRMNTQSLQPNLLSMKDGVIRLDYEDLELAQKAFDLIETLFSASSVKVEKSSGDVFADLGVERPELQEMIKERDNYKKIADEFRSNLATQCGKTLAANLLVQEKEEKIKKLSKEV